MITRKHRPSVCPVLIASIACALLAVALPAVTQAAPPFPPRPTAQPVPPFPSRPAPPQPTPTPTPRPTPLSRPPAGGFIELRFQTTPEGIRSVGHWQELWTVVQQQDGLENWQNLEEGWQGTFDEFSYDKDEDVCQGKKTWWVAKADLGRGPFRWVIYQGQGGELFAQSEPFYLPHSVDEVVKVEVSLVPSVPAASSPSGWTGLPGEQ